MAQQDTTAPYAPGREFEPTESGFSFVDTLENILYFRWHFIAVFAVVFGAAAVRAMLDRPFFIADGLIQVEARNAMGLGALTPLATDPQGSAIATEMEVLRSRAVLNRAADSVHLPPRAVVANRLPLVGEFLAMLLPQGSDGLARAPWSSPDIAWGGESLAFSTYQLNGFGALPRLVFSVGAQDAWTLTTEKGEPVAQGVGKITTRTHNPAVQVQLAQLSARPGTRFWVQQDSKGARLGALRDKFKVMESSRGSNMLRLTYQADSGEEASQTLNAVADAYLAQNLDKRGEQADKSLRFLDEQLPKLKQQLDIAEQLLNDFRAAEQAMDMTSNMTALLQQDMAFEKAKLENELKRAELLLRYEPAHPAVTALDAQVKQQAAQRVGVGREIRKLPAQQQRMLQLMRDADVTKQLYVALLNNAQQLQVSRAGITGNVSVLDRAETPGFPAGPNRQRAVAIGGLLGLFAAFLAAQGMALLTRVVRDPNKLERATGLNSYGVVPVVEEQETADSDHKGKFLLASDKPNAGAVEVLRAVRTSLMFALSETPRGKVLLFTSALASQGKSFMSANVAFLLAATGKRVLMVDADVRRSSLRRYFGHGQRDPGLSDALSTGQPLAGFVQHAVYPNIDLLPCGKLRANPGDLLSRPELPALLNALAEGYDYVVIDSPPLLPVADAVSLAACADITVFVVRQDTVLLSEVDEALEMLTRAGCQANGLLYNGYVPSALRQGYRYGYGYRGGRGYRGYRGYRNDRSYDAEPQSADDAPAAQATLPTPASKPAKPGNLP